MLLKTLQGELENNTRKPRYLLENRHCDSLKKSTYSFSGNYKEGRCS
jgi:hypothetical protein